MVFFTSNLLAKLQKLIVESTKEHEKISDNVQILKEVHRMKEERVEAILASWINLFIKF